MEQLVSGRGGKSIAERQIYYAGLRFVRLIGDFDSELDRISFPEESRRIGLDHEVFRRDRMGIEQTAAGGVIVSEPHKMPFGQCLRHSESHADDAIGIRGQLREEEGRFVQVFAGGNLGQIGLELLAR